MSGQESRDKDIPLGSFQSMVGIGEKIRGFSLDRALVVALRVVRQLKRDRRTIGLITFAPIFLMVLFGYALSGDMSDIRLGLVDEGGHPGLLQYLEGVSDFNIVHLGSTSDAEGLVDEGYLHGSVVVSPGAVEVLLDASSPQIAENIMGAVKAGYLEEMPQNRYSYGIQISERYIHGYDLDMIETTGPAILGLVVFFFTFITAAISFLRERVQGSLEKFMVSPLSRLEMVLGYILGFSVFAVIQSATTLMIVVVVFGVPMKGNPLTAFATVLLLGACALVLGATLSNFAKSEFQVVQFIPVVITPQIVLCGVFWPLQSVPQFLRPFSYLLPLTYSSDALRAVMLKGSTASQILPDLLPLVAFLLIFLALATFLLKREVG